MNLGTFGGTQGLAFMVNNRGQVVGSALNTVPDAYSFGGFFPGKTQARAFVWENGVMRDLGTLGGPDAVAFYISQSGEVSGTSYINNIPNGNTGVPTTRPFLWKNGKMTDLGSLGGTISSVWWLNNNSQVVGYTTVAGDQDFYGFFWDGKKLINTGSLGGHQSYLGWVNDSGVAVGASYVANNLTIHATLWSRGKLTDIGTLGQDNCAWPYAINNSGQIVGVSLPDGGDVDCRTIPFASGGGRAFLMENGQPMVDLNALIENPPPDLRFYWAYYISDNGQIYGSAVDSNSHGHTVVLIPDRDCNSDCEQRIAEFANRIPDPVQPSGNVPAQLGGVPGMGRFNPLARLLEAHQPSANPAQTN